MDKFYDLQDKDGLRMTWNTLPANKLSATRAVLPMAVHYQPYKDLENLKVVDYDPVRCRCSAVLNPYCQIDFNSKIWMCPFCHQRNQFPPQYKEYISPQQIPVELQQDSVVMEYEQKANQNQQTVPNVFLFMIDTCISKEEMEALKTNIQDSLEYIPQDAYVGLITYGRYVFVHELGFQDCPKSFALKGSKNYTPQQIQEMLGLGGVKNDPRGTATKETVKRFLLKLEECSFTLNSIIDNLYPDPWVVGNQERQQRAIGCAMNVAITLMESCPYQGGRILSFIGGPCTIGPGQVVDLDYAAYMRSYLDIQKDTDLCKHVKKSQKFYQGLTQRAIKSQTVIDLYCYSIDQVGILEMKSLSEKTGGYISMYEEFQSDVFKQTYKKIFELDPETELLKMGTAARCQAFVSKELKINGALGSCTSIKQPGPMVAELEIGQGGTNHWFLGGIDRSTTLTVLYDHNPANKDNQQPSQNAFFQFQTIYKGPNGKMTLRVTTVVRKFADISNQFDLQQGFDQEAACVAMARYGIWKAEQEESIEVLKWLDRTLIRFVTKFANYKKDDPSSFSLSDEFSLYPQFMYHLRRSHLIQTFGASPDEICFYRASLNRESISNCVVMIQPALFQYSFEEYSKTINLDQNCFQNKVILLLDTYFHVLTWKGDHIQQWIDQKYHEQEEYQSLRDLIQAPLNDLALILEDRFPAPIFFETNTGHTKERFLKSRVDPSGQNNEQQETGHYITDDASLQLFMDHLIRLAVQSQN